MTSISRHLRDLQGSRGWLERADTDGYVRDWLDRYGVAPLGVARPASTAEVAACRAAGVALVPLGGRTSLCGGAVATSPETVVLSLERMRLISTPDIDGGSVVEAGVVLAALHDALEPSGLIFPLHLGAEGQRHPERTSLGPDRS